MGPLHFDASPGYFASVLLVLTCVLTTTVHGQSSMSEEMIVLANRGIVVPLGRSVYVSPDDLQIRVRPSDKCVVTVLENDPLSQRPGRLMPSSFPCNFGAQDLIYSHFGSRNPPNDVIRVQIRYDTFRETILIPLAIHVEVSFMQLEVIVRNMPITVDKLMGVSTPIDENHLEFDYARGLEQCKLSVLPRESGQPRYGFVMNDSSILQMVDCDDFLRLGVRYKHNATTNSPNKDYIPLVVEIIDPEGQVAKREYFQMLVRILDGKENERPSPEFSAKLSMEVDQFVMTALTPDVLAAEDVETPSDFLIFNITKPLAPGEGYFVSTDDRNQLITSFYQRDIRDLKIAYKPPEEDSDVRRVVFIDMQVMDSDGALSDPFILMVVVKPMNTLAPVVTTNQGIQLFEGQSRALRADSNFRVSDEDNLENVRISVANGLRHGTLTIPEGRKFFTPADLRAGSVVYTHDDSDSYSDNIIFRMNDGENTVEFLFPIWVFPEDDEAPQIQYNTMLEINKHDLAEITPFLLSATDADTDDALIRFILEPPYSEEGIFLKRQFQIPEDPDDWQFTEGVYEQIVDEFTQGDIVDGKIFYQHVGEHRSDFIMDNIKFFVVDSADPPNRSNQTTFVVKIAPVDDQLPYVYPNTSLHMDVEEFEMTEFKRRFMRYTDDDTDDRDIRYHVTTPPFDTDSNTPMESGIITFCEDPDVPVMTFTQAQVNHRKICYQPPTEELGVIPRILQFVYDVEDSNGNLLKDEKFTILLQPLDNQPPEVTNGGVQVLEGGFTVLNTEMLDVQDPDTEEENLMFVVMEIPAHGQIKMKDEVMEVGDFFTRSDIQDGNIVYYNNGEEIGDDKFMIDISDGIHHVPVKFKVGIKGVDDEVPALVGVQSEVLRIVLEVKENSVAPLSPENIRAVDPDSDDMLVKFTVERKPYEGVLLRGTEETIQFTQSDIVAGLIMYEHTGGEIGLTARDDYFELSLADPNKEIVRDGDKINKILVEVKILPHDNEAPIVSVEAPFEVLESEKATIFTRHLDATDVDTEDGDILCLIIAQPMNGYLENISPAPGSEKSRVGKPISSFTIRDIRSEHINYVQSLHKGIEPREDSFIFHCSDGLNQSPDVRFDIEIYPANDEEPEISLREFIVVEGGNLRIDLPILNVLDKDEPVDRLTFVITEQPKHGKIVRQTRDGSFRIQNFTLDDISGDSTIEYEHDDSETTSDGFAFYLIDGAHNISRTVPIKVYPLDDETPRLTINNGLQIDTAGETKLITNKMLKAEDLDSNDPDLMYFVRLKPKHGYLRMELSSGGHVNITQGGNFTQRDINKRRIEYVHNGIEGVRDLIKFDISDGLNSLIDRYFYVTVEGLDMLFPRVINKGVELPEGGMVVLTTDLLSGTDLNTPDESLTFIVTRAPGRGHLETSDMPGVPISTFTQLQLAGNKIRYVHNTQDEMKMDSFEFEVTDGYNPVTRTFRISLSDVDNRKPVLMFQTLRLKEGDNKLITPFELKAEDRDTRAEKVTFTVTQVPIHGLILFNTSRVVTVFTQEDLNQNLISYQHDGSETAEDSFSFTVTDGTHSDFFVYPDTELTTRRPQTMAIEILPIDNGIPQISINRGGSYLSELAGDHLGFRIGSRALSTEDRDSADDSLLYSVSSQPKWGYLINRAIGNRSISNWTQGENLFRS
ncbi:extracellular matrix protein 3 [Aplysia californica]|uniref:Extracellular matrix protein 3 n=1 Tax=Aplysia californica TaxID=6500 RepID=A0ABM1AB40_APLCA|nr:extracellular matrix protein 3 [Aplysia californica]